MIELAGKSELQVYPLSEGAITIEFGQIIDGDMPDRVNAFDRLLNGNPLPGMYQTVPAYASLTVFFDPSSLLASSLPGKTCFEKAKLYLPGLNKKDILPEHNRRSEIITIPVCYDSGLGTDLAYVADYTKIAVEEIIRLHSQALYKVCMIGFIPGFAYLGGLDPSLTIPRKPTPVKVAPGAVGIAAGQTAIYPLETPGGWQIIGRTPLCLFDAKRQQPSLLKTGDQVKFEPISFTDFENYSGK